MLRIGDVLAARRGIEAAIASDDFPTADTRRFDLFEALVEAIANDDVDTENGQSPGDLCRAALGGMTHRPAIFADAKTAAELAEASGAEIIPPANITDVPRTAIVVLDDGETFSEADGARLYMVPDEWDTDRVEQALSDGELTGEPIVKAPDA